MWGYQFFEQCVLQFEELQSYSTRQNYSPGQELLFQGAGGSLSSSQHVVLDRPGSFRPDGSSFLHGRCHQADNLRHSHHDGGVRTPPS